jgi:hypothetical protein
VRYVTLLYMCKACTEARLMVCPALPCTAYALICFRFLYISAYCFQHALSHIYLDGVLNSEHSCHMAEPHGVLAGFLVRLAAASTCRGHPCIGSQACLGQGSCCCLMAMLASLSQFAWKYCLLSLLLSWQCFP